jgi:hypothetical protein
MKILIGTFDIAGWVQQFRQGFEASGHSVTSAVFTATGGFYNNRYDINLTELYNKGRYTTNLKRGQYFQRLVRKIKNKRADAAYRKHVFSLIDEHDLVVLMWTPFIQSFEEYAYIRKRNKKFICLFVGSDARYFQCFSQEFDISAWVFPADWKHSNPDYHLQIIRHAEKYADLIYSVPDQAGLQLKPYNHIHVPVSSASFNFHIPGNKKLKVVHAPSIPFKKGTDIIEKTLEKLQNEGLDFELVSVRNMPNAEVLKLLSEADVLVDELVYHGPGALSFEAMLSGCAVATRCLENPPGGFRPPVWSIDATDIYEKLKTLLSDHALIRELAIQGRAYAQKNNEPERLVRRMLQNLQASHEYEYFPRFLRDSYVPGDDKEIQTINQWTAFVKDCSWYKEYIQPGEREGLVF